MPASVAGSDALLRLRLWTVTFVVWVEAAGDGARDDVVKRSADPQRWNHGALAASPDVSTSATLGASKDGPEVAQPPLAGLGIVIGQ